MIRIPMAAFLAAILALVAAGSFAGAQAASESVASQSGGVTAAATDDTYSDPTYFPIRGNTTTGCVKSNCPGPHHGVWAIDIYGNFGDGIYPMGNGIAHVGGIDNTCSTLGGDRHGTWVYVDHGGGLVSRYHHLRKITISDGQKVTTSTQIGEMGSTGDTCPAKVAYLHLDILKVEGDQEIRQELPQMSACHQDRLVRYPEALGYKGWDDVAVGLPMSNTGDQCVPQASRASAPANVSMQVQKSLQDILISWSSPPVGASLVHKYAISYNKWKSGKGIWGQDQYFYTPAPASSYQLTGLKRGSKYKVKLWGVDGGGATLAATQELVMAEVPAPPRIIKAGKTGTRTLSFRWAGVDKRGSKLKGYSVGVKQLSGKGKRLEKWKDIPLSKRGSTWKKLKSRTRYALMVRGINGAGYGEIGTVTSRTD